MNLLNYLYKNKKISIDSADLNLIKNYKFNSITSNPTLILKSFLNKTYNLLLNFFFYKNNKKILLDSDIQISLYDKILIFIVGNLIPFINDKISIEIPARISFNYNLIIIYSKKIIFLCNKYGININKVLIKIPGTDSGIKAAKKLKEIGIETNITLIFDINQVKKCLDFGVYIISPFVGRISDSIYCKYDSGVNFVKNIYTYKNNNNYKTKIMAASFRNINQIINLTFCDCLTISPIYFLELLKFNLKLLFKNKIKKTLKINFFNKYSSKLIIEGIKSFDKDHKKLINIISTIINNL
ncbi:transaldolase [Candidatus Carsonella ruddii CS isolate Thao2000]|uniref:Transaldolase n=1 Tax=Candidatus Carsonella ruddii CS isolate Thao2000 TaxID=1202537 RepID=J7GSQ7_CARRU|nr:transaldolase family protein [Candidatus Carsonella ruddii]AFP83787.1 transaldolase [Candidatus Carsonella ruddii CS isolate Thao2000]